MNPPDTFCSRCGAPYPQTDSYPRQCSACGGEAWANPKPVVVSIMPVGEGVACVRRGIPPHIGQLALPGGFQVVGETWAEAAVREVMEETGQHYKPEDARLMSPDIGWDPVFSTQDGNLLLFVELPAIALRDMVTGHVEHEIKGVEVVTEPIELAFPAHTEVLRRFLGRRPPLGLLQHVGRLVSPGLLGLPMREQQEMARGRFGLTRPPIISVTGPNAVEVFSLGEGTT